MRAGRPPNAGQRRPGSETLPDGTGLAAISWGLAHERMSIAGQVASASQRVIGITLARMMKRRQFGQTLFEHQALRMRMADL